MSAGPPRDSFSHYEIGGVTMPELNFDIPDSTLRTAFDRTLILQVVWLTLVGAVFLALPESRFTSPSWQFVVMAPHGDDILGGAYILSAGGMLWMLWQEQQRCLSIILGLAGMLNWTLGVFLLAGALNGSAGGLGFPLAMYPGAHMISTAATLSSRGRE